MDTAIYSFAAVVTVLVAVQVTDRQQPCLWNNGFQKTRLQLLWVLMMMWLTFKGSWLSYLSSPFFCSTL